MVFYLRICHCSCNNNRTKPYEHPIFILHSLDVLWIFDNNRNRRAGNYAHLYLQTKQRREI